MKGWRTRSYRSPSLTSGLTSSALSIVSDSSSDQDLEADDREDAEDRLQEEEEVDPLNLKTSDVPWSQSLYDAPLIAAFGGVVWVPVKEGQHYRLYPMILLIFCVVLFVMQNALIIFLRISLDQTRDFNDQAQRKAVWKSGSTGDLLISGEMLLIVIVALSLFNRMYNTFRCLLFIFNYWNWNDIHFHAKYDGKRPTCAWSGYVLVLVAAIPMLFKYISLYKVLALSASIIMNDTELSDAIFDCLALEFLSYLDEVAMLFVEATFDIHFDSAFRFRYEAKDDCHTRRCAWLRTGTGGRRAEQMAASFWLAATYMDQSMRIMYAVSTDILPMARDFCSRWRWLRHQDVDFLSYAQYLFFLGEVKLISLVHDPFPDVDQKADPNNCGTDGRCGMCTEEYAAMSFKDYIGVLHKYKWSPLVAFVLIFGILCLSRFGGPLVACVFKAMNVRSVEDDLKELKQKRKERLNRHGLDKIAQGLQDKFDDDDFHRQDEDVHNLTTMITVVDRLQKAERQAGIGPAANTT